MDIQILARTYETEKVEVLKDSLKSIAKDFAESLTSNEISESKKEKYINFAQNIDKFIDEDFHNVIDDLYMLGGKFAGVCYMKDNYFSDGIQNEEAAIKRANNTSKSGHHSVFDHGNVTLLLTDIPKILAMILNSLGQYTTSEKSARYTIMKPETQIELDTYNKWQDRLYYKIKEVYPNIDDKQVIKLAQENARYMLSVFTPTYMVYTTTFRQLCYIVNWFENLVNQLESNKSDFSSKLAIHLKEFISKLKPLVKHTSINDNKSRNIDFLEYQVYGEAFEYEDCIGDSYCLTYRMTFAGLAQAQRHRTINYIMQFIDDAEERTREDFYLPQILINDGDLREMWFNDIIALKDIYPQGTYVNVVERGTVENFLLKAKERLCGRAQLEIMQSEAAHMMEFISNQDNLSEKNRENLFNCTKQIHLTDKTDRVPCTKCQFKGFQCKEPCTWGSTTGLTRLI